MMQHLKSGPTEEQLAALRSYAAWEGKDWKAKLRRDWTRAGSEWPGEWALLQQLRNRFGPKWLARFELTSSDAEKPYAVECDGCEED